MQIAELNLWIIQSLQKSGIELSEAEIESRWILEERGIDRLKLISHGTQSVHDQDLDWIKVVLKRRETREPLQHILGRAYFRNLALQVSPQVLIPRPETEELVSLALTLLQNGDQVADIGTGSGAIALALAQEGQDVKVYATDLSQEALSMAQSNAQALNLQVSFLQGDGLKTLEHVGEFSMIISNPPYIPQENLVQLMPEVYHYEPHLALSPGDDPLRFYRHFAEEAAGYLKKAGYLLVELESDLAEASEALFLNKDWKNTDLIKDIQGKHRFLKTQRC